MNVYEKIQNVKKSLLEANLKKSGFNKVSNYYYYELADFLPTIIKLCTEQGLFTSVSFNNDVAMLKIVNTEKPDECEFYTSPMKELELKGCNQIQALGGVETYSRRYLYMSAFDIVENDMFDGIDGEDKKTEVQISTYEDAINYKITFGKHNGKTLGEIQQEDTKYLNFLYEKGDDNIKNCLNIMLEHNKGG